MALLLALQDFSDADADRVTEQKAETLPGYDAGFAAGMAEAAAAQAAVDAALVQAIEDISFGFAEARQIILQGLTPLFEALVAKILPATVDTTYHTRLVAQLTDAAHADVRQPCELIVHPDQVAAVSHLVAQLGSQDVAIKGGAEQPLHAALIQRGPVETAIDAEAVLEGLKEIMTAFFEMTQEQSEHG